MTFSEQQAEEERKSEIDRLISKKLESVDDVTPELLAAAINDAYAATDPDEGELIYEMD